MEFLLNLKNIYEKGRLSSSCFLKDNKENYIITCNGGCKIIKPIKIFDFKGKHIKEISDSNDKTDFIDIYYDKELLKNYIIKGNKCCIKSYDYNNNRLYHKYFDKDQGICFSITIKIDKK